MSDYTNTPITSGFATTSQINTELTKVETSLNSKIDKSGSTLTGELDMNSNKLLNVGPGLLSTDGINLGQLSELVVINADDQYVQTKTTTTMVLLSGLIAGTSVVQTAEFSTGSDGGGTYDAKTVGSTQYVDLPDGRKVIVSVADSNICFVLRDGFELGKQLGMINDYDYDLDTGTDNSVALNYAIVYTRDNRLRLEIGSGFFLVLTTIDMTKGWSNMHGDNSAGSSMQYDKEPTTVLIFQPSVSSTMIDLIQNNPIGTDGNLIAQAQFEHLGNNIAISGIAFDGDAANANVGLEIGGAVYGSFENIQFNLFNKPITVVSTQQCRFTNVDIFNPRVRGVHYVDPISLGLISTSDIWKGYIIRTNGAATDKQDHIGIEVEGAFNIKFGKGLIERCSNGIKFHNGARNCILDGLFTEAMGRDFTGEYYLVSLNEDNETNVMLTICGGTMLRGDDTDRGRGLIVGGFSYVAISDSFINNVQFAITQGTSFSATTRVITTGNLYTLIGNIETGYTDATGDTDGSTAVITGMTTTVGLTDLDEVTVSAGFPGGTITIVSVDSATQITVDVNSNSVQSNVTVTRVTLGLATDIPEGQLIGTDGKDGLICKNLSASNAVLTPKIQSSGDITLAPGNGGTGIVLPSTATAFGNNSNRYDKYFGKEMNLDTSFACTAANFKLTNLATSDPSVSGQAYLVGTAVHISP